MATPRILSEEEALAYVEQNDLRLQVVPWGQLKLTVPATAELCLAAVKRDGKTLEYVPEN